MFKRLRIPFWALVPMMALGQPAVPANNPGANLRPVMPNRPNAVGGGVRIKDLTSIRGARPNQLRGFGVVVGLQNSGDKDTVYSKRSLANLLKQHGVVVPDTAVSSKNIAAVMVTANLPAFVKNGALLDVNVAAMGDATSLSGGTLIFTPLIGADGKVYVTAQGEVLNNAFSVGTDNAQAVKNHPTAGRVVNGGTVEKEVKATIVQNNMIEVNLHRPDFTMAKRLKDAINAKSQFLGGKGLIASAIDGNSVRVLVPDQFQSAPIDFIAHLHAIEVVPDSRAVVVMNEKTGTIVATARVRILSCAISHGNIHVNIAQAPVASQPGALAQAGNTQVLPRDTVTITESGNPMQVVPELPTVEEVAQALNKLGATPRDMMAIFQELKRAGVLQADLIVQ